MASRNAPDDLKFNLAVALPYELRVEDFRLAMQDAYDFFYDVNEFLEKKGLGRLDDMLRPAAMSGVLSDMLTSSLARHARALTGNRWHNGHPDLVVRGLYAKNSVEAGEQGVEVKATRNPGGAVDTHGAREQWMCVFVYAVDGESEPATARRPMRFTEVYIAKVTTEDFRSNARRGDIGTRTATLHREGLKKLRHGWIYLDRPPVGKSGQSTLSAARRGKASLPRAK